MPKSRYIYLDQGKIKFDECTKPPHAEVIAEVLFQIISQDRPFRLFDGGTGGGHYHYSFCLDGIDVNLIPGRDKQPDGHWTVNVDRLQNFQPGLNPFPMNAATGELAPQLVFEVAVSNETMPILIDDLDSYFAPEHELEHGSV